MQSAIYQEKYSAILYDADLLPRPNSQWARPEYWPSATALNDGRGEAWKVETQWGDAVLKHYRRGGMVAKFLKDQYRFQSWAGTRSWYEWRILAHLSQAGLPVPRPWLAYAVKNGFFYRCDLLVAYIANCKNFAEIELQRLSQADIWYRLGQVLHRLCLAGVEHVDFNLSNVLLRDDDEIMVVDFDRAKFSPGKVVNPSRQIQRLLRSYQKHVSHVKSKSAYVSEHSYA